jgi:hypothetical protein
MTRNQITNSLLDFIARNLAEDIIKHDLTDVEVRNIAAQLAPEALRYAMEYRGEEKAEAMRMAREERRAGA